MQISDITKRMIAFSSGNHHDINHFLKVWSYAKTIGESEGLDPEQLKILEVAAIVHDIACPLCRVKYGDTAGPHQEMEGALLAREFLKDSGLTQDEIDRVVFLVGHHHTLKNIEGNDYQILIEADYLVNSEEKALSKANIAHTKELLFKTQTGKALLDSIYGL